MHLIIVCHGVSADFLKPNVPKGWLHSCPVGLPYVISTVVSERVERLNLTIVMCRWFKLFPIAITVAVGLEFAAPPDLDSQEPPRSRTTLPLHLAELGWRFAHRCSL